MTRADIAASFRAAGIYTPPVLGNANYDPIDLAFVQGVWAAAVAALPECLIDRTSFPRPVPRYIATCFDCLQQSIWLQAYLIVAVAEDAATTGKPRNTPAAGVLFYLVNGNVAEGHGIDWFVDYPPAGQTVGPLRFFEKGTGDEVFLSADELGTVTFEEAA